MSRGERRLTLCENMRAVPYVPFYLALAGDFWRSEGLDINHVVSPSTTHTPTKLLDGSVDVSWGGPMRVMMHHDADPACPLVCFAQVVARDPFLLVGRTRKPRFRWRRSRRPARRAGGRRADAVDDVPGRPAARRPRSGSDRRAPRSADGAQPRGVICAARWMWCRSSSRYADAPGRAKAMAMSGTASPSAATSPTPRSTRRAASRSARRDACHAPGARHGARAGSALRCDAARRSPMRSRSFLPKLAREALARIVAAYRSAGLWARRPELPSAPYLRLKAALVSGGLDPPRSAVRTVVDPPF